MNDWPGASVLPCFAAFTRIGQENLIAMSGYSFQMPETCVNDRKAKMFTAYAFIEIHVGVARQHFQLERRLHDGR